MENERIEREEKQKIREQVLKYLYIPREKFNSIEEYYKNLELIEDTISNANSHNELHFEGQVKERYSIESEFGSTEDIKKIIERDKEYRKKLIQEEEEKEENDITAQSAGKTSANFIPIDASYEPLFPKLNETRKEERKLEMLDLKDYLRDNGFKGRKTDVCSGTNRGMIDSTIYEIFDEDMSNKIQRREEFYTANDLKELPVEARRCTGYNPESYVTRIQQEFKL